MLAVIFKAEIAEIDDEYSATAKQLRVLAFEKYGCIDFVSATEGNQELAISYWPSKEHITKWHNDPSHKKAQELGKSKWYKSYQVQIAEVQS